MKPNPSPDLRVELPAGALRQIVTGLGRKAGRKKGLPVLDCVRVSHDGSGVAEFCAYDSRSWHFARPPRSASGHPGAGVLVPMTALRAALKGLSSTSKVVLRSEGDRLVFAHGTETRALPVNRKDDFPPPPTFSGQPETLPPTAKRALVEALRCVSTDETRPLIRGIALDLSDRTSHHIVATDGRHLYSANSFSLPVPGSRILGPSPLLLWDPFVKADAWKLRLRCDPKAESGAWEISSGIWRTVGNLVDGAYPNWRQVVPEKGTFRHRAVIPPLECPPLADKLQRLPVASDGRYESVLLQGDGKELHLRWRDAESKEVQSLRVRGATVTREPFRVALPRPELAKAIAYGLGEVQVVDEMSAVRLSDGKGRQMIIMPLRVAFPGNGESGTRPVIAASAASESPARSIPAAPSVASKPARSPRRTSTASDSTSKAESGAKSESESETGPSLEDAMRELGRVKETLRLATSGLQSAAGLIRQARQEQKSSDREMRTVRSTLRSLTRLRF